MTKKIILSFIALITSMSVAHAEIQQGTDYEVINPIPQLQENKIEVLEFFGYFCPHCQRMEPIIQNYAKKFASDTYLRSEHIIWQPKAHFTLARIAAAVNSTHLADRVNPAIYNAIINQGINLTDIETFKNWAMQQHSPDYDKLLAAFNSNDNVLEAKRMQDLTDKNGIDSTPTIIVGGKYRVILKDYVQSMKVIGELIKKVRTERGLPEPAVPEKPKRVAYSLLKSSIKTTP